MNLLASKRGRLAAFFFLYLTEGIPLGFTATAIGTQMRRQGLGPEAIGAFVGSLYLPWAWKFLIGPFVDVFSSDRWGRRRTWIVIAQVCMVATLMAALPVDFTTEIKLFTAIILLHNVFGATQDVAIDALACNVLRAEERGLANGLMFGGAYLGQTIGGAGVLLLSGYVPSFNWTFPLVAAAILLVTVLVALPLREPPGPPRPAAVGSPLADAMRQVAAFVREAGRSFVSSRAAAVGVLFALLPAGAHALGLALQSNLAVELGLDDAAVGRLSLVSTVLSAAGCVAGGWVSDRFGRRRMLALYVAAMSIPTLYLAAALQRHGWVMPVDPQAPDRPAVPAALVEALWTATLAYALFNGLMYGTRTALFMDVTNPLVAATQFTAYMALLNLVIAYSAWWQGWSAGRFGYPATLVADAVLGVVGLALLPLMRGRRTAGAGAGAPPAASGGR